MYWVWPIAYMPLHNTCMCIHRHLIIISYIDHKLDVSYLCVIFWKYYYYYYYYYHHHHLRRRHRCCCYMYFIVTTHSVLCLLLSNDKFCIHFGGSLEYWINEYDWISVLSPVPLSHCWQSYILHYKYTFVLYLALFHNA